MSLRGRHAIGTREAQIYVARANGATYREVGEHFEITASRARDLDLIVQRKIEEQWHFFQRALARPGRLPLQSWEGR